MLGEPRTQSSRVLPRANDVEALIRYMGRRFPALVRPDVIPGWACLLAPHSREVRQFRVEPVDQGEALFPNCFEYAPGTAEHHGRIRHLER